MAGRCWVMPSGAIVSRRDPRYKAIQVKLTAAGYPVTLVD